uniref:EB domain-containing protein n=1 Tax=Rhipicephalus microplus TaxID=6941 RepID=A0A6M2D8Q7_RHIMP
MPLLLLGTAVLELICLGTIVDSAIIQKRLIGTACNTTVQCQALLPKSQCIYSSCFCIGGHYYSWKNNSCVPLMLLGENCTHDNECSSHLMCSTQRCTCMPGYKQVKDWCEPTRMQDDTERFMEFPQEQPNLLVVILKGLGIIALKVSLFYLLAKVMCFSCNHMVSQQEYTAGEIYSPSTKPCTQEPLAGSMPYPSTITTGAQYQVPLYIDQAVQFPKEQTANYTGEQHTTPQPAFPA